MPTSSDPRLSEFAAYSKTQSNLSLKTAKDYVADVTRFARFIEPTKLQYAQESHVVHFISDSHERGLKRGTIARRLFAMRAFYQFLMRKRYRDDDPTVGVSVPEESSIEERVVLSREEVRRTLTLAGDRHVYRYTMMLARDKALLSLFYSGLKRNEVIALNLGDLNLEHKRCRVGERLVPLNDETVSALRAYLVERPKIKDRALFVTVNGERLTPREGWVIAKKAGLRAGVDKPVSPESLRTAFAVHWIEEGRNPFDLAPILGIETSGIENYAKLARTDGGDSEAFMLTGLTDAIFDQLDMRRTKAVWHKIIQRVQSDPEGAITQTRTLLESVCKQILTSAGVEVPKTENLSGLCKRALSIVVASDGSEDDHAAKFTRIAAGLVDHLSTYRNAKGDAHASLEQRAVEQHQARFAVGLAASTAGFLVHCFAAYRAKDGASTTGASERTLGLSKGDRELLRLLLQTASRTSPPDKRSTYSDLLRRIPRNEESKEMYLSVTPDEISLIKDIVPADWDGPKQFSFTAKHLAAKLSRLN